MQLSQAQSGMSTCLSRSRAALVATIMAVGSLTFSTSPAAASSHVTSVTGPSSATGVDANNAITFTAEYDCAGLTRNAVTTLLAEPELGKWYRIVLTRTNLASCNTDTGNPFGSAFIVESGTDGAILTLTAQYTAAIRDNWPNSLELGPGRCDPGACTGNNLFGFEFFVIGSSARGVFSSGSGGGSGSTMPDPTASTVATAVEQSVAAGVEGTSSAVLVRDGEVVPVVSLVSPGVGPRGGVVLEADGLRATVASSAGARPGSGVIVPPSGDLAVSIVAGLVPGVVVEVWVNSTPRLVAAARVPDTYEEGDALAFTVPLGAPLDGGEPIGSGAHTLQIRMYTDAGFEVLATGITVGGVVPTRVSAGGGPVRLDGVLFALLGAAGLIGLAVRRTVVSD